MASRPTETPTPAKQRRRRKESHTYTERDFQPFAIIQEILENQKPPDVLYHYTGTAGLVGILESSTLRLSHVSYLNDRSEMVYAKELIADVVRQRRESATDERVERFLHDVESLIAGMFQGIDLYVSCFCEDGDLLSQWRGYSRGAGMYAISFSSGSLHNPGSAEVAPFSLYPVVYKPEEQRRIINAIIDNGKRRYLLGIKGPTTPDGREIFDAKGLVTFSLSACLIFFKHSSFEAEQEWRIVFVKTTEAAIPVFFRPDPWYPTPFTEAHFGKGSLPLAEIKCGPAPEPQLAMRAVEMLLSENDYSDVAVTESKIPLRW